MHVNGLHREIKYKCNKCEKEFRQPSSRKAHINYVHDKIKHPCTSCNYEATRQESLTEHIQCAAFTLRPNHTKGGE